MKEWDNYRIVLALHRAKTLRGAADELGVNHATISRRLVQINKFYGSPLFERIPGGYRETELGKELIASALKMEEIAFATERHRRANRPDLSGPIKLSIPPTIARYLIFDELLAFSRLHPKIELTLQVTNRQVNLDRSEADVVIRGSQSPPEHLVGRQLFTYSLCYYAAKDYLKNTSEDNYLWIGKENDPAYPEWTKDSPFPEVPVGIRIDDIIMRHDAAAAGLGLTRGACYMADQEPKLIRLPGATPRPAHLLWILTHPDLRNTPRIKILMQYLSEVLLSKQSLVDGASV
ncbi:LysR family transcriptional regulator [Agarilytica rhodophyticola]|uniref:LysR family transcriptional regulator n=1 Tax=Agarilytica rhodophyticola TaxID=1737490 RepID=UPI000B344F67|nr:LysR family transcriptional regulator [Agarilytica rhodophyticola]